MNIDIKRIAKLSMLSIPEKDIARFENDMQNIVGMVDKLPDVNDMDLSLDTSSPMRLREDKVCQTISRTDILQNAPQMEAGCFVVPRVVE